MYDRVKYLKLVGIQLPNLILPNQRHRLGGPGLEVNLERERCPTVPAIRQVSNHANPEGGPNEMEPLT